MNSFEVKYLEKILSFFFRRVIDQHNVNALFCVPTALRIIRRADPDLLLSQKYSMKSYVFLHNGIDIILHGYIFYDKILSIKIR